MGVNSFNAGDIELGSMIIDGIDISEKFVNMIFHEHIFSPIIKATVEINQFEGMIGKFTGAEDAKLNFNTPSGNKRRYDTLRVNSIGNVTGDDNQRSRNFTVDLVSKHGVTNNATPNYQKSFRNKQISDVIGSILKDGLGLDIPFNIDKTRGLHGSDYQPVILTQKSPLRHIDDLRRMAVSSNNYDGFLLFAGIGASFGEELNFKSIFDILKVQAVATITNKTGFEVNTDIATSIMNNAIEIWMPEIVNVMNKGNSGSAGTTKYDLNRAVGSIPSTVTGKERQTLGSGTSLNPGVSTGAFVTEAYNGLQGTGNLLFEDSTRPESLKPETAAYTQSLFADISSNFVTVKIPGNSNLKVGDIVNLDIREATDNNLNNDTQYYGKNMIVGLTNYVGPISDSPRYVTYLDLVNVQAYNGKIK